VNGLPKGSNVGELEDTNNERPHPEVTSTRKRKKGDNETQSPDAKNGKKIK